MRTFRFRLRQIGAGPAISLKFAKELCFLTLAALLDCHADDEPMVLRQVLNAKCDGGGTFGFL
jgi:hypothetical protein